MEIIKVELPVNHEIGFAGCFHFGNGHQHLDGIQQYVNWLKAKGNRYGFLMGDISEAIHKSDKRHEDALHKNTILDQYADAVDMFKPVRKKLLGALAGNHDFKINSYGDFVDYNFCRPLGIPYGTYSSRILIYTDEKKLQYKVFATHGNGTVRSVHADPVMREAAEKSQVKRKLTNERNADCILNVIAHFHKSIIVSPYNELHMIDDEIQIKQKYHISPSQTAQFIPIDQRWYLAVPGFIRKYGVGNQSQASSYVERAGMSPVELGFVTILVKNTKIIEAKKIFV
jgi:hypothetical protein